MKGPVIKTPAMKKPVFLVKLLDEGGTGSEQDRSRWNCSEGSHPKKGMASLERDI